jgi:hypothetical protein
MKKYCGFIEVWGSGSLNGQHNSPLNISLIKSVISNTKKYGRLYTVALFKIKLKQNEQNRSRKTT